MGPRPERTAPSGAGEARPDRAPGIPGAVRKAPTVARAGALGSTEKHEAENPRVRTETASPRA